MSSEEETQMPKSVFILGPALDNVIEPVAVEPIVAAEQGRRQVSFRDPATAPGGNVNLQILPPLKPDDLVPINVYAFYVQPADSVPAPADRTPDWFFKSGAPSGSIHVGAADQDGAFTIAVSGVKPSLQPYFVQTVLEFSK
jgi:hypothetical protein